MLSAKEIAKEIIPPVLVKTCRRVYDPNRDDDVLFDGDDRLFKSVTEECRVYGEYGCGKSTRWILGNTGATVYAVDTNKAWIESVQSETNAAARLVPQWIDVGELGDWGRPVSYAKRSNFQSYTDWIWSHGARPQVVLIDGRFRVCCFLTCLKYAPDGTKLLFDDYTNRTHYRVVEEFADLAEVCGRQALFVVSRKAQVDSERLDQLINQFRMVLD